MMNILTKSANLAPYLKTTSQAVASQLKPLAAPVVVPSKGVVVSTPEAKTSYSLSRTLPTGAITTRSGPAGKLPLTVLLLI
jgi:hypothetical protein